MTQPFLSVIIPAYNEAERLPLTLVDIDKHLSKAEYTSEILVVNDGSTDNTSEVVRNMTGMIKNLKLVDNAVNRGKGAVVRQGMLVAKGNIRLFTDADNSTSIDQFDQMVPYFSAGGARLPDGQGPSSGGRQGFDVVIGSRAVKGSRLEPPQPFYKQILGKVSNLIIQLTNVPGIWDTQCGFKAFTGAAAEKVFNLAKITGWGFDIEILALARAMKFRIKEIPVRWVNDARSHVKLSGYLKTFVEDIKIRLWLWAGKYDLQAAATMDPSPLKDGGGIR
jgi:glycosyltransferase involved in cell wall biosynthesis